MSFCIFASIFNVWIPISIQPKNVIALIENNLPAINDVCKEHHVTSLYLFGSAANGQTFRTESDIDFLYEIDTDFFENHADEQYDYIDNLFDLEVKLGNLLNKEIDLVSYRNIHNRFFKETIDNTRVLIYGRQ